MRTLWLVLAVAVLGASLAGCEAASRRDWTVAAYTAYANWIADSGSWPEGVPRLTKEQRTAFAAASWEEHERAIKMAEGFLKKEE